MLGKDGLNTTKMAGRILNREDNIYKKEIIYDVLKMYIDEIQKALMKGERVLIRGVGTIIPEVKTHVGAYNMPQCNTSEGNPPPYTLLKMSRSIKFGYKMNDKLQDNVANGIYGLEKLPFSKQQMTILKDGGYVPEDAEEMVITEEEDDSCTEE